MFKNINLSIVLWIVFFIFLFWFGTESDKYKKEQDLIKKRLLRKRIIINKDTLIITDIPQSYNDVINYKLSNGAYINPGLVYRYKIIN